MAPSYEHQEMFTTKRKRDGARGLRCACVCLTAARRHRGDLQRVGVGGADGLLLALGGHFDGLAHERQLLAGDHVLVRGAGRAFGGGD